MKTNHFVNSLLDLSGILFAANVFVQSIPEYSRYSNRSYPEHGSCFDRNKYSKHEGPNLVDTLCRLLDGGTTQAFLQEPIRRSFHFTNKLLPPVSRKSRKSSDIILFVSSKQRRLEARNFAVI